MKKNYRNLLDNLITESIEQVVEIERRVDKAIEQGSQETSIHFIKNKLETLENTILECYDEFIDLEKNNLRSIKNRKDA